MAADCKKGLVFIFAWVIRRKYLIFRASDIIPCNETPCHMMANPIIIAGNFCIHARVTSLPTVLTPTHNTPDIGHIFCIKTDQGSSWIAFATVYGAIISTWSKRGNKKQKSVHMQASTQNRAQEVFQVRVASWQMSNGHQYRRFLTSSVYYFSFLFKCGASLYICGWPKFSYFALMSVMWVLFYPVQWEEFSHIAYCIIRISS